jgi:outer membrane lipoprotein-sorting protein
MPPAPSRSALAALGLAVLLVTAGCLSSASGASAPTETDAPTATPTAATPSPSDTATTVDEQTATASPTATPTATATPRPPTAAEIDAAFESRLSSLESFTATRTQTTEFGNRTQTATTELWVRPTTGEYRTEVVAPDDRAGNLVVAGTETTWIYDEETDTVTVANRSQTGSGNASATLVSGLAERYEVTDYELTTVDGEETYRVSLVPETETGIDVSATAWLSQETYFPVAVEQTYDLRNRSVSMRTDYENVTLNATVPDERFAFDPPANATVERLDLPETETFDSLSAMRDSIDVTVPDPEVPAGYEFQRGRLTTGNHTSVSLRYQNDTATLHVSKMGTELSPDDGENVTVGDHEGRLRTYGETTMVSWTCDGWTYSVAGALDRAELLDAARSMDCE